MIKPTPKPFAWRRNLVFVWFAQVLSLMGFAFAMSFAAYYIQALGVTDSDAVKMWNGLYQAAGPLAFGVMGPIWGALGDRFGRRLMMLRACLAASVIVYLMGCVSSVEQLIFLRLMQGMFTGTVSAAMTLVATTTPGRHHGVALGSLQTSIVVGWMGGSALGGYLADRIGYATTMKFGGVLLLVSALIVLLGVKEDFRKPNGEEAVSSDSDNGQAGTLVGVLPIMALFLCVSLARRFDMAILPLFVQELNGGQLAGSATRMGQLGAACSVAVALSAVVFGYLTDRLTPARIAIVSVLFGSVCTASQFLVGSFGGLVVARLCVSVAMGGLDPACQVWLTRSTIESRRGRLIGYSTSARSLGWIIASLSSAYIATRVGVRPVFLIGGALLLLMVPVILRTSQQLGRHRRGQS